MWQDSLLSLCYDRPPAVAIYNKYPKAAFDGPLDYKQAMFETSRIGINVLADSSGSDEQLNVDAMLGHVFDVEQVLNRVAPHLQSSSQCPAIQQRQQFFALRLQTSFLVSIACRPAFRSGSLPTQDARHNLLIEKGKASLLNATKAFLDLHLISVYAQRSWSMTHEGLSSALLLGILGETQHEEVRDLQKRLIKALTGSQDGKASGYTSDTSWLTRSHRRALQALSATLQKNTEARSQLAPSGLDQLHVAAMSHDVANSTKTPLPHDGIQYSNFDMPWDGQATESTPFSYLDSLIWGNYKGANIRGRTLKESQIRIPQTMHCFSATLRSKKTGDFDLFRRARNGSPSFSSKLIRYIRFRRNIVREQCSSCAVCHRLRFEISYPRSVLHEMDIRRIGI